MSRPLILPQTFLVLFSLVAAAFFSAQLPAHTLSLSPMSDMVMKETQTGGDFRLFWAQAHLAASDKADQAYMKEAIAAQAPVAALGDKITVRPSLYPPVFFLLVEALGKLDFAQAWLVYSWGCLVFLLLAVLAAFPRQLYLLPVALGFGAVWITLSYGQNSIILAALYLLFTAWAARHPLPAGVALGLASFKPHFGILAPLVLVLRRQWALLCVASAVVGSLIGLSYWHYGQEVWLAYQDVALAPAERLMSFDNIAAQQMISLYAGSRQLGVEFNAAIIGHAMISLVALGCLWMVCRTTTDRYLPGAAMVTAALIIMPHAYTYDLVLLLVPLLVLIRRCQQHGWSVADVSILVPAYIVPFFAPTLAHQTGVPLLPFLLLVLLILIAYHSLSEAAHEN